MESIGVTEMGPAVDGTTRASASATIARSDSGAAIPVATSNGNSRNMAALGVQGQQQQEEEFDENEDMESLLPGTNGDHNNNGDTVAPTRPRTLRRPNTSSTTCCGGRFRSKIIGNMTILFPTYYTKVGSSWGVMGPHWWGPVSVWCILVTATHYCLRSAHHFHSTGTAVICYIFFAICTYLLLDVSLRDPGICHENQIPGEIPPDLARTWRWCDFCQVYQPPDGAHCPDCNVCVAGYDHHCVWMGTCIGRKNYRQFVRFNVSWLYYVFFALLWIATLGPIFLH